MKKTALLAATTAALALAPDPADACSPPPCWPGAFVPGDGARVPANVPGLVWRPMGTFDPNAPTADPTKVVLATTAAPGTPIAFTATLLENGDFLLVPDGALAETTYTLVDNNTCGGTGESGPRIGFEVGPAAPLPGQLGTVDAVAHDPSALTVGTASGSCTSDVIADQVSISLGAAADVEPWRDMLLFQTFVDGQPFRGSASINQSVPPGESWIGRAADTVYTICESADSSVFAGVEPGVHVIEMRATLPGTTLELVATAATAELACSELPPPECDDTEEPCFPSEAASGCSAAGAGSPWLLLVGLAGVFAIRRRRRAV